MGPYKPGKKFLKIDYPSADTLTGKKAEGIAAALEPDRTGPDIFSVTAVRPGLCMYRVRLDPKKMPAYAFEIKNAPIQFAFCLTGKMHTVYTKGQGKQGGTFVNEPGTNSICHMSHVAGQTRSLSDEVSTAVAIQIDRELLAGYLAAEMTAIPERFKRVLRGRSSICALPMTVEMHRAARQVCNINTTYQGHARQLYLEGKALELLALQIRLLTRYPAAQSPLSGSDIDRIHHAGDILLKKMQAPPTISVLSRMVGINEFKLKKEFKQIFGTTIFRFLQRHRMKCAREMIVNQGANVSQAADFVGYVNVGHFIACYREAFGTTPGSHKRTLTRENT